MKTAKIFTNGQSQAVRLPKAFRFKGKEVYIKKHSGGVLLLPKDNTIWNEWEENLLQHHEPFMIDRMQPVERQKRENLD